MQRPLIAVTTSSRTGWRVFPLINLNLWIAGGRGVRWGVGRVVDLEDVDGLIIGGGTSQIQKNIISERGLGMPKEPKVKAEA